MVNTGYKQSLFWGNETLYGSAAVIGQSMGLVQSVNPTESNSLIKVRTLGGTRDYNNIVPGKFEVSGNFEYFLQGGAFLRQAIGEDTGSTSTIDTGPKFHTGGSSDGGYVHVMGSANSPTADSFPSFTLEFTDEEDDGTAASTKNLRRLFTGCRVNSLAMNATVDEPVKITVDFQSQGVTKSTAAATAVGESTDDPYVFYQGAVYASTGTINYDTAMTGTSALAEVNSFDFSINNNLEAAWYISGTTNVYQSLRGLKSLIPKGRDYEATLNINFQDKKMYERFLGAEGATTSQATLTGYSIALDFVRTGVIGGTGDDAKDANDDYIRIVLTNAKFNDINIAGAPQDIVTQNIGVDVPSAKLFVVDADADYKT